MPVVSHVVEVVALEVCKRQQKKSMEQGRIPQRAAISDSCPDICSSLLDDLCEVTLG